MKQLYIKLRAENEEVIRPCKHAKNAKNITLLQLQDYAKINGVQVKLLFM